MTIAKNNLPVVDLVPHKARNKRQLGTLEGMIDLPDDFNGDDPEIHGMFHGENQ